MIWFVKVTMLTPDPRVNEAVRALRLVVTLVAGGWLTSISLTDTFDAGCSSSTLRFVPGA